MLEIISMNRILIVSLLCIVQLAPIVNSSEQVQAKFIPGLLIKEIKSDIGNEVNESFIELTKEWREYKAKVDSMTFSSTKVYEDERIREDIHYQNGELIQVDYLETGYKVLSQKQYYRNGKIYICMFNVDKQGDFDSIQYYIDGQPVYLENLSGTSIDWEQQWWE